MSYGRKSVGQMSWLKVIVVKSVFILAKFTMKAQIKATLVLLTLSTLRDVTHIWFHITSPKEVKASWILCHCWLVKCLGRKSVFLTSLHLTQLLTQLVVILLVVTFWPTCWLNDVQPIDFWPNDIVSLVEKCELLVKFTAKLSMRTYGCTCLAFFGWRDTNSYNHIRVTSLRVD